MVPLTIHRRRTPQPHQCLTQWLQTLKLIWIFRNRRATSGMNPSPLSPSILSTRMMIKVSRLLSFSLLPSSSLYFSKTLFPFKALLLQHRTTSRWQRNSRSMALSPSILMVTRTMFKWQTRTLGLSMQRQAYREIFQWPALTAVP